MPYSVWHIRVTYVTGYWDVSPPIWHKFRLATRIRSSFLAFLRKLNIFGLTENRNFNPSIKKFLWKFYFFGLRYSFEQLTRRWYQSIPTIISKIAFLVVEISPHVSNKSSIMNNKIRIVMNSRVDDLQNYWKKK